MKKRIIATALSALMLLSLIPLHASANGAIQPWYPNADSGYGYNSKISGEAIFSAMMEQAESGKAPDSFNDDTLTPYGTQRMKRLPFLKRRKSLNTYPMTE